MSWGMSVLFNTTADLATVVEELEALWLVSFERKTFDDRELYRFEGLTLLIDLFDEHGMESDVGIDFESYRYEMDLHIIQKLDGYQELCRSFAIFVANQLNQVLSCSCIVVEDLQKQLLALEGRL